MARRGIAVKGEDAQRLPSVVHGRSMVKNSTLSFVVA
jgi:hypothetical protein